MRWVIKVSYNGVDFRGWQIQPNQLSVQELLQQAISKILRQDIEIVGAGRTDTGVHA
ncbi:MAG: tRNA pseudouridine(38-40) synthase TruA, partial [Bacteroidia bacterium]